MCNEHARSYSFHDKAHQRTARTLCAQQAAAWQANHWGKGGRTIARRQVIPISGVGSGWLWVEASSLFVGSRSKLGTDGAAKVIAWGDGAAMHEKPTVSNPWRASQPHLADDSKDLTCSLMP